MEKEMTGADRRKEILIQIHRYPARQLEGKQVSADRS